MSEYAKKRLRRCPQRCGGGLTQTRAFDGRPKFTCGKCGHWFTAGKTGAPYAVAVPLAQPSRNQPLTATADAATSGSEPSAAFTPGPWSIEPAPTEPVRGAWILGPPGYSYVAMACRAGGDEPSDKAREQATARLIAAAPELYEALSAAKDKFAEYALLHYRKRTAEGDEKALANQRMADMCDAALSKAEGRS